ncbi:MAG: hypothetical protein CM15mP85_27170 [Rhodobacterales bacterium]|nr:MAG: hypothetical protein CM15mP85_27170 [Rhodobacterales bacterium]
MIENFLAGTATLFGDPFTIGIFIFGVLGGMLFGAIPGVSMLHWRLYFCLSLQIYPQLKASCCLLSFTAQEPMGEL